MTAGDADSILPLVYDELRRLAAQRLRHEPPDLTLTATALVHEAYMRLLGPGPVAWDGNGHFFAAAANAMRRILIERARRQPQTRGGGRWRRLPLEHLDDVVRMTPETLLALNDALADLEQRDAPMAEVVTLRVFAGMSVPETAKTLQVAPRTVDKKWAFARSWLRHELAGERNDS